MSADSIAASTKYLEIDLTTATLPLSFETAFKAAYPTTKVTDFLSRTVVAVTGSGVLTLTDPEGAHAALTFAEGSARSVMAGGIYAASGVTLVQVFL